MSARITRKNLYTQIDVVNQICENQERPDRYELSIWSPGDGWTRYQLVLLGGHREVSRVCTCGEMYEALYTLIRVLQDNR
jgi:hypothetical protein